MKTEDNRAQQLEQEFDDLQKQWAEEDRLEEIKMKAKGWNFKTTFWIHPTRGDDYQKVIFSKNLLTEDQRNTILKNSRVKTDFQVKEI